jgi:hypothetical protein
MVRILGKKKKKGKKTKKKVKRKKKEAERKEVKRMRGENLLDLIPIKTKKWRRGKKVSIVVHRAKTVFGRHFCDAVGISKTYKINLDDYGSAVWLLCDGKNTIRDIGKNLKERFGEKVEPLYDRLSTFIMIMKNEELIKFVR